MTDNRTKPPSPHSPRRKRRATVSFDLEYLPAMKAYLASLKPPKTLSEQEQDLQNRKEHRNARARDAMRRYRARQG